MAASIIDGTPPATVPLPRNLVDVSVLLPHCLLAESMLSLLDELNQPLNWVMLQQCVCRREPASNAPAAKEARGQAEGGVRRTASLVESTALVSNEKTDPATNSDMNKPVERPAEPLSREPYDRRWDVACKLAPLLETGFSPTMALEAILRAIMLGSRATTRDRPQMSVTPRLAKGGQYVQIAFRSLGEGGASIFTTITGCGNYVHVGRTIESERCQIGVCGDELIIAFPVVGGLRNRDAIDA